MSSFESSVLEQDSKEPSQELLEYFESYVSDAESQDEENKKAYIDLDKIKNILQDIEKKNFTSAFEYVESEIIRVEAQLEEWKKEGWNSDMEDRKPYLEKLRRLKEEIVLLSRENSL